MIKANAAAAALAASVVLCAGLPAQGATLDVSVSTAGLSGVTGELVFDFTDGGPPPNSVMVQDFMTDGTLGSSSSTGSVAGALPGTVTLSDASIFSEFVAGFTFANAISFRLTTTDNAPAPGSSPDEFSLFLRDSSGMNSLITTNDPTGLNTLLTFDIDGSPGGSPTVFDVSSPNGVSASIMAASVTGVPEPGAFVLVAFGAAGLLVLKKRTGIAMALVALAAPAIRADQLAYQQTGADAALTRYGLTGKGVIIAILDRGIQWQNPDFVKPDGTTRIRYMLDMTGQNYCDPSNPAPVEYTAAQINAALNGGPTIPERDAVGHGTVTAGIAAGNGRAFANGKYKGFAPDADLIIVKLTSEGAPAHDNQPAETPFTACHTQALSWLDQKIAALGEPVVGLINSGVQLWGPIDGTSVVSGAIDQVFGKTRPGRIYVEASGDEGGLPTHAGGTYSNNPATVVNFTKADASGQQIAIWYTGAAPARVTVAMTDGTTVGPVGPDSFASSSDNTVSVTQYSPGSEFYPATSTSGDRFVNIFISGHAASGSISIQGVSSGGKFDMYADAGPVDSFSDHLVAGRLTDWASTKSAISVGAHVLRTTWVDIDGIMRDDSQEGSTGQLWFHSAGGPTRDGRLGIAFTAPGQNIFATYATNSYWETFRFNLIQDGGGWYGRQGATSGASPIAVGAAALMLQAKPDLTSDQARALLTNTATADGFTGSTPNNNWGYGKINIKGALDALCSTYEGVDVSPQTRVTRGGLRRNPANGNFLQIVTVKNTGPGTLQGPLSLALDGLKSGVILANAAGATACLAPLSPYLTASSAALSSGQSVSMTVELSNPANQAMTYTTRVLSGSVR